MLKKLATRRHAYLVLISTVFFVIIVILPTILCTGCSRKRPETLYTLLVNVEPAEAGIVFIEPSGPSYKKGTTVFLFALGKADNYAFYQWTGDLAADDDNPAKVVMNANKNVTAHFKELDYNLTIEMEGKGRVIRKIVTGEGDAGPVQIQLTAHPDPGWAFLKWTGDLTGSDNPARLILDGDKTITAYFTEVPGGRMITGRITDGRSGSPAKLATVTLVKDGTGLYNTVADPEGWYSLPVKAGEEVELIAAKEGFAGSRFQGVVVPAGESFRADMIMQNPEVPGGSVTPPSLTVAGVNSGQTISGTKRISVQLKGEHEPRVLYIDIGSESNRHPYGFASNPFSIPLNTRGYPDGPSFIYIAAYDQNQNLVTTRIPVIIKNGSPAGVHLVMRNPCKWWLIPKATICRLNPWQGLVLSRVYIYTKEISRRYRGISPVWRRRKGPHVLFSLAGRRSLIPIPALADKMSTARPLPTGPGCGWAKQMKIGKREGITFLICLPM